MTHTTERRALPSITLIAPSYSKANMGRTMYVCINCGQHFTRRYSSVRHNLKLHSNGGEVVPYLEYLVGRTSGRYRHIIHLGGWGLVLLLLFLLKLHESQQIPWETLGTEVCNNKGNTVTITTPTWRSNDCHHYKHHHYHHQ